MRKTQVASEFIFLMAFMFFVFIVFIGVTTQHMGTIKRQNDVKIIQEIMELVHTELSLASVCEDGYYRVFKLPSRLSDHLYQIELSPMTKQANFTVLSVGYINYSSDYTESMVLPPNIFGSISVIPGDTPINVTIKKEMGNVSVTSVAGG